VLHIHFTDADVRRTRVAAGPDPLWEAVLSLTKLRSAQLPSHHAWWRRDATRVLGGGRGWLDVLCGLVPPKGNFPDFLTPSAGDGTHWARVAAVSLAGFPRTVQAGLFATSPQYSEVASLGIVQSGTEGAPSLATGRFDHVRLQASGRAPTGAPVAGARAPGGGQDQALHIRSRCGRR